MMKRKNEFKVIEKEIDKFVLQEEENKNKFFLFWIRYKKPITFGLVTLIICLLLVITGLSVSMFRGSNDYDITYIVGDENIIVNGDPSIDEDDIKEEILGEIARSEGIVLLSETVMSNEGDVIYYFTDKSSVVVKANGKIYRVSSDKNGHYGINKNGKVDDMAVKVLVTSTTTTLLDGTVITYYSDGTAKVELKGNAMFIRDSNNIELLNENNFEKGLPSGVALSENISNINGVYANSFTDNSSYILDDKEKYVLNKNTKPNVGDNITFDLNNAFKAIGEQKYGDYIITHFLNGSATLTDKKGNIFYVRKSGDLRLKKKEKEKEFYEILPNKGKANSRGNVNCSNKTIVTYFDNGVSVVIDPSGKRYYIEDADQIIYDGNKNISSSYEFSNLVDERTTENGEKAYNFDNGKSQVINEDGSSYIVDTSTLEFKPIEEEKPIEPEDKDEPTETPEIVAPEDLIEFIDDENSYDNKKNIRINKFKIKNRTGKKQKIRIVINEKRAEYVNHYVDDKFEGRLSPEYVLFFYSIDSQKYEDIDLDPNNRPSLNKNCGKDDKLCLVDEKEKKYDYLIYEGYIGAVDTLTVVLTLKVDYKNLPDNKEFQNLGFLGTLRVDVDTDNNN